MLFNSIARAIEPSRCVGSFEWSEENVSVRRFPAPFAGSAALPINSILATGRSALTEMPRLIALTIFIAVGSCVPLGFVDGVH